MRITDWLKKSLIFILLLIFVSGLFSPLVFADSDVIVSPSYQPNITINETNVTNNFPTLEVESEPAQVPVEVQQEPIAVKAKKKTEKVIKNKREFNKSVAKGARHNRIRKDGNPAFPYVDLDHPFVDTTGKASRRFIKEIELRADEIREKGYQFGGIAYYEAKNEPWEVANNFGTEKGIGYASKDNGLTLVIALHEKGKNGYAPAESLAVGSGIQGLLPDIAVTNIFKEVFTPVLEQTGDWEQATLALLDAVEGELNGEGAYDYYLTTAQIIWLVIGIIIFIFLVWITDGEILYHLGDILAIAASSFGGGSYNGGGGSS